MGLTAHAGDPSPARPGAVRLAAVQHGDYAEALRLIRSGAPEPYFGMAYSLSALADLFAGHPHLVVSLNAPRYERWDGSSCQTGLPPPRMPRPVPRTLSHLLWGRAIRRRLASFRPTHVLLRTGDPILACAVLSYCRRRQLDTLVVMASVMAAGGNPVRRHFARRLVALLNEPFVFLVGNHKHVATRSLVEAGLRPEKAIAYDYPGGRRPEDHPLKRLPDPPLRGLLFVGQVSEPKGVTDLLEAVRLLRRRGFALPLTVAGDGPALPVLRRMAADLPEGAVRLLGRIGNAEAFDLMRRATLVCVPTRHQFPEAMPLTLTEALASRTPVVASDHPVFRRAFREGEGLRFFRARDPESLAAAVQSILGDPALFERLSDSTAAAFARVECRALMGELFTRWKATFPGSGPPPPRSPTGPAPASP